MADGLGLMAMVDGDGYGVVMMALTVLRARGTLAHQP
jgi:hypothetical protein